MKSSVHTYNVLLIAQGYSTYVMVWTYQDMFTNVTLALSFPLHMNVRLIEKILEILKLMVKLLLIFIA